MMQASSQRRTALYVGQASDSLNLLLYRPNFFYDIESFEQQRIDLGSKFDCRQFIRSSLNPDIVTYERGKPNFVGVIASLIAQNRDDFWEMQFVRAEPGSNSGPMMYETAMQTVGWLSPDLENVSGAASSVWKKFYDRKDVVHKSVPKGWQSDHGDDQPWLQCQYRLKSPKQDTTILRSVHRMAVEGFSSRSRKTKNPLSVGEIEDVLKTITLLSSM